MGEQTCPTYPWCKSVHQHAVGDHVFHFAHVGDLLGDTTNVMVFAMLGVPAEVCITSGGEQVSPLTPLTARTLGRAVIARGRDIELGRALVAAADLIEGVAQSDGGEA